jgi:hypothetical protein
MPDTTGPSFQAVNLRGASEIATKKGNSKRYPGRKSGRSKSKRG